MEGYILMKEFVVAAIPWVLCGIAVAILCARLGGKKDQKPDNSLAIGMAFGLLFSPVLNSMGLWENHGIGFALCPLWGMALASLGRKRDDGNEA